jgi:hypothetical protein
MACRVIDEITLAKEGARHDQARRYEPDELNFHKSNSLLWVFIRPAEICSIKTKTPIPEYPAIFR